MRHPLHPLVVHGVKVCRRHWAATLTVTSIPLSTPNPTSATLPATSPAAIETIASAVL